MSGFRHEALIYHDEDELLAGTISFLNAGLEAEEAMLVAMPRQTLTLVRGELNGSGDLIEFVDMEELGRNPGRIISAWKEFVAANVADERGARGIGEPVWASRSTAELEECSRHEALLNLAFADSPEWSLLCPYDARALGAEVLGEVEHSHPYISAASFERTSTAYREPSQNGDPFAGELPAPTDVQLERSFTRIADLPEIRGAVSQLARAAGLDARAVEGLVLAVNEVAANSLLHGGGRGLLRLWREPGYLCCDVTDEGRLEDPLVGRSRPELDRHGGRGLWLANQLCDLVQIRSSRDRTVVRLRMAT